MCIGWLTGAQAYGIPRTRGRWAYVNGFVFYGERGESYAGDPEVQERSIRERWWVREYERWFDEEKPAIEAANRAFQAVDVAELDDHALHGHVRDVLGHVVDVAPLHFSHRGRELVRGELQKAAAAEGVDLGDLSALYAGASPMSSRPAQFFSEIASALRGAGVTASRVTSLDDIRAVPKAAELLDAYLEEFGLRLVDSYDLAGWAQIERPELIVAAVRACLDGRVHAPMPAERPAMSDDLRQLLEEARISAGTEDDDDGVCIFWPLGLLRRALLEVARRRGFDDLAAIFEVDRDELDQLLDGAGPSAAELAARLDRRRSLADVSPPEQLGGESPPTGQVDTPNETLTGKGIGTGVVRGRACVVGVDGEGLSLIEPDDVLIAVTTTPGYNAVMPIISAVATETEMGHTVICARELGIPAVIGVRGLVASVPRGAMVEVDAANGVVRVIANPT